jgi:hypothetical protein
MIMEMMIMCKQLLLTMLNTNGNYYYISEGNHPSRFHLKYTKSNKTLVPSKKNIGDSNICDVVFGHMYEDQSNELYWFIRANHSANVIGHNCIPDVYNNVLTSQPVRIADHKGHTLEAKKVLKSDIPNIVNYIINLNKNNISLRDVDYDPNR